MTLKPSQRRIAQELNGQAAPELPRKEAFMTRKQLIVALIFVLLIVLLCMTACGGGNSGNLFNPSGWFSKKQDGGFVGPPDPVSAGEMATYASLIDMAKWSFGAGILALIAGTVAGHWIPPLKALTSIGATLIIVGIGCSASCMLLDRYGGWTAAILLMTLAGALGMWMLNRWREGKWTGKKQSRLAALRAEGKIELAEELERELA